MKLNDWNKTIFSCWFNCVSVDCVLTGRSNNPLQQTAGRPKTGEVSGYRYLLHSYTCSSSLQLFLILLSVAFVFECYTQILCVSVLKKVKHRLVENMSSGTADALGLSRAILCNGEIITINTPLLVSYGDCRYSMVHLTLQMDSSKDWRSWRKQQSSTKVKINPSTNSSVKTQNSPSAVRQCTD